MTGDLSRSTKPQSIQCSLAFSQWVKSTNNDEHLSDVYLANSAGKLALVFIHEQRDWLGPDTLLPCLADAKVSSLLFRRNGLPEIRMFFQGEGGELRGYNYSGGSYQNDHALPCGDTWVPVGQVRSKL